MKAPLMATWFGVALLISLGVLFAIEKQQAQLRQNRIAWLIGLLDSPDPRLRHHAADQLVAMGRDAVEPVRAAIREDVPADRRAWLESVYDRVAIYQPGGEWTHGLGLCLRADLHEVRPGETVTFTTTVCNLDDDKIHLELAGHFECGWGFRRIPDADGALELSPRCEDRIEVIMHDFEKRVADQPVLARSSFSCTMPALLVCVNARYYLRLGQRGKLELEVPADGVARFRMTFNHTVASFAVPDTIRHNTFSISLESLKKEETFTVRSNDVLIRILPPARGYVPPPKPAALAPLLPPRKIVLSQPREGCLELAGNRAGN